MWCATHCCFVNAGTLQHSPMAPQRGPSQTRSCARRATTARTRRPSSTTSSLPSWTQSMAMMTLAAWRMKRRLRGALASAAMRTWRKCRRRCRSISSSIGTASAWCGLSSPRVHSSCETSRAQIRHAAALRAGVCVCPCKRCTVRSPNERLGCARISSGTTVQAQQRLLVTS